MQFLLQVRSASVRCLGSAFGGWSCRLSMAAGGEEGGEQPPPWTEYLGQTDATDLDNALFFEYEYSIDQLMEIAGLCVAQVHACMLHV